MKSMAMGIDVLLVEDSPGDIRLTQEAFREANSDIRLHVAMDGVEALAFLAQEGEHSDAPRPDLILLDLNLPKKDGREVLKHIRGDEGLKSIPTVILTTSDAVTDINQSYKLQANSYLSKPVQLDSSRASSAASTTFGLKKPNCPKPGEAGGAS